jgi:2-polyprenyl-3-methyl-5-hydroxy-6-metoxy-1,4-benzoquinol methylase
MKCCSQCDGIERVFDARLAADELRDYRRKGPAKTTQTLLQALRAQGVDGLTLLDIGGGVGAIQHALLANGVSQAVSVDASGAYLWAAQQEAERLGQAGRVTFRHGDFVALAAGIDPADIVTLDRVICCYPDMEALVGLSAARARRLYGVVFPRDAWWMRLARPVLNLLFVVRRNPFRFYVHRTHDVEAVIRAQGWQRVFHRHVGLFWQVGVYAR